ncbi:MAG: sulfatase-like hydrolase/transferase [Terracidiphilus sp.]|nr:sulfatase-like hydrolase/transferase [Terracidiphilus sp.]
MGQIRLQLLLGKLSRAIAGWIDREAFGIELLPWLVASAGILLAKRSLFVHEYHGSVTPYASIGYSLRDSGVLHFAEKLSLYRSDLLCLFLAVPLFFALITVWCSRRTRFWLVTATSFVAQLIVTVEALVLICTNAFQPAKMIWIGLSWAVNTHSTSYFTFSGVTIAKSLVPFGAIAIAAAIAARSLARERRRLNRLLVGTFGLGILAGILAYVPSAPRLPWSEPMLAMAVGQAFAGNSSAPTKVSAAELIDAGRREANLPQSTSAAYSGSAKGYNVLFFIMESMSAHAFDPAHDNLDDMPNVRRLMDHSFLMRRHYTTIPDTSNATLAILTSLYSYEQFRLLDREERMPSLIRDLDGQGYKTGYYGFVWKVKWNRDDILLKSLGFQNFGPPVSEPQHNYDEWVTFEGPPELVAANDRRALSYLKSDLQSWANLKQRFAAVYFPEVSHDPYREFGAHKTDDPMRRGHALAVQEDVWLGEILDTLEKNGQLNNTIVVLTGDHGMRFMPNRDLVTAEDHGLLPDVEMRVPMLIAAPGVLSRPVYIDAATSHVDIAPTVRDLLGLDLGVRLEEGLPVYNAAVANQRVFFSTGPFGSTGYYSGGSYYCADVVGLVYKSKTLDWKGIKPLPYDDAESRMARAILKNHASRQRILIQQLAHGIGG